MDFSSLVLVVRARSYKGLTPQYSLAINRFERGARGLLLPHKGIDDPGASYGRPGGEIPLGQR